MKAKTASSKPKGGHNGKSPKFRHHMKREAEKSDIKAKDYGNMKDSIEELFRGNK